MRGDKVLSSLQETSRANSTGDRRTRLRAALISLEVGLKGFETLGSHRPFHSGSRDGATNIRTDVTTGGQLSVPLELAACPNRLARPNQ